MKTTITLSRLVSITMLFITANVYAKRINVADAEQIARTFINGDYIPVELPQETISPLSVSGAVSHPAFYIFNRADSNGFVIVSGDDKAPAIIGFSTTGVFDIDNIPDNLASHLNCLGDEIASLEKPLAQARKVSTVTQTDKGMRLLTPDWNQSGFPYNALIPGNVHAGCVPAAMSIIMGAWQWPITGEGSSTHSGKVNTDTGYQDYNITLDHNIDFNLRDIPFEYNSGESTPEQDESLATLLLHTSVSVESKYSPSGSGATVFSAMHALAEHFKYQPDLVLEYNESFENIESHLREELAAGRPVIYSAQSNSGGHAFICDGVWNDYFHFNFGWGGYCNGYYLTTLVNPTTGDSYSQNPYILYPIQPRTTDYDYTPRTIPVVYDEIPEPDPEVEVSDDYSPVELSTEDDGTGLASPRSSYPKGQYISIYFSGLKWTGRFSGTKDAVDESIESYELFDLAIGVSDKDGNLKAMYPTNNSRYIYRNSTTGTSSVGFTPDIEIASTDILRLYTRQSGYSAWKEVKGLPGVNTELSGGAPSSALLPFSINIDTNYFTISNAYGQLSGQIVKGQNYSIFIYPKQAMSSAYFTVNGEPASTRTVMESDGLTVRYYLVSISNVTEKGIAFEAEPLQASSTDLVITTTGPNQLESLLNEYKAHRVRNLTIIGEIDIHDLRYISSEKFSMLGVLDLTKATIVPFSAIYHGDVMPNSFMYNHHNISEVYFPEGLKTFETYVLSYSWALSKISIPAQITSIPERTLCNNPLSEVTCYGSIPADISESFVSSLQENSILYVPVGSKSAYESHPLWSRFSQIIEKNLSGTVSIASDNNGINVTRQDGRIIVTGLDSMAHVAVYTLSGQLIWRGMTDNTGEIPAFSAEPLLITVNGTAFKVL